MDERMYQPISELTTKELAEVVRDLNAPTEIPPCRVCGAKLKATSAGGGQPTVYHCSSDEADFLQPGRSMDRSDPNSAYNHYEKSGFQDRRHADPWAYELAQRYLLGKHIEEKLGE